MAANNQTRRKSYCEECGRMIFTSAARPKQFCKDCGKKLAPGERARKKRKARESHWRKTGVSETTINWMREGGYL